MIKTLGIIPAAGDASRFGGVAKELLPIDDNGLTALENCVRVVGYGNSAEFMIFSTPVKAAVHESLVPDAEIIVHPFDNLAAVVAYAARTQAAWYVFAMPDTVIPMLSLAREVTHDIVAGTFETDKPGRFGIFVDDHIVDKPPHGGTAWGVWVWSWRAMQRLAGYCEQTKDLTAALNLLIGEFGYDTFPLDYYVDFATFADYKEFVCSPI